MKSSRNTIVILFALAAFVFARCSGEKKETASDAVSTEANHEHESHDAAAAAAKPEYAVDQVFQSQIGELFSSYLALKEAFVATDAAKVKSEAAKSGEALAKVDMKLVSDQAHTDWMAYHAELTGSLKQIESESDIEKQREHFSNLSNSMYKVIKAYGLGGVTAYYEFCPMAFNDQGAYWLSDTEKIRNPYFGDKMLSCGSVQETLK